MADNSIRGRRCFSLFFFRWVCASIAGWHAVRSRAAISAENRGLAHQKTMAHSAGSIQGASRMSSSTACNPVIAK
jgi:hypothetical protein